MGYIFVLYLWFLHFLSLFISCPVFPFFFTFLLFASLLISKLASELAEQKWSGKHLIRRKKKGQQHSFTRAQKGIYFCRWKLWKTSKIITSLSLCSWSSILRIIFQPWKLYNDLKVGLHYIGMIWTYTDFKIMHYYNDLLLATLIKILGFSAQWLHIPSPQYVEVLIIPLILLRFNRQAFIWIFPMQPHLCRKPLYKFFIF